MCCPPQPPHEHPRVPFPPVAGWVLMPCARRVWGQGEQGGIQMPVGTVVGAPLG